MRVEHGIGRIRQFAEISPAHGAIEGGGLTITYRDLADRGLKRLLFRPNSPNGRWRSTRTLTAWVS